MGASSVSYYDSVRSVLRNFVSEYKDNNVSYAAITSATLIFWMSGTVGSSAMVNILRLLAVSIVLSSGFYTYYHGRPFGISLEWTPTHYSQGQREPDKMSESRGNALIQDSDLLIHAEARFPKFSSGFKLQFDTSSDITAELENRPRREQDYDPDTNILECADMSERTFPLKLRIYPDRPVEEAGRYHEFSIVDDRSQSTIVEIDVIDVRK